MNDLVTKIIKFLVVGGISTAINYGFFYLLHISFLHYIPSSILGYILGLIAGFFLNKAWTYDDRTGNEKTLPILYLMVYLFSLLISTIVLYILVDTAKLVEPKLGNFFAICISTILNFLGTNFFVFKERKEGSI
ncbi:MAG: GtrA family protein [Leptospiraceae bacterium]|nr:GtrA family protein [Leptospiraceae bacterium]